jgi:hypothetical protein
MKKLLLLTTLISMTFFKMSFALISGYLGVSGGSAKFKAGDFSTNGLQAGLNTGLEVNLLVTKLGLEAFFDKALKVNEKNISKPIHYGLKGKIAMNLIVVEPYATVGIGREKIEDYKNNFGLVGAGLQGKLFGIGAYIEANYSKSLSNYKEKKSSKIGVQVGLKYYFF